MNGRPGTWGIPLRRARGRNRLGRRRAVLGAVAVLTGILVAGAAGAAPAEKAGARAKPPAARKHFAAALKNFLKARSYAVSVEIEGGISGTPDHRVRQRTVHERYRGEVYGKLMRVPERPRAFRTPKTGTGAIYINGGWKQLLSHQSGVRLDRLFSFPQILLKRAARYARKARWLEPAEARAAGFVLPDDDEEEGEAGDNDGDDGGDEDDDSGDARGRTVVRRSPAEHGSAAPRVLRIEVPPKEALRHFIQVENSGCMSKG